jgi:hypothetical protein
MLMRWWMIKSARRNIIINTTMFPRQLRVKFLMGLAGMNLRFVKILPGKHASRFQVRPAEMLQVRNSETFQGKGLTK